MTASCPSTQIAVVGAGITGLAAADVLRRAGVPVTVFDKSRGLGGRIATRRRDGWAIDHGAQFATARGPDLAAYLAVAENVGAAAQWAAASGTERVWIGAPGMSDLVKPLAEGLDVTRATPVTGLTAEGAGWRLDFGAASRSFSQVIVAVPAPQAMVLGAAVPGVAAALADVRVDPCWALLLVPQTPRADWPDLTRSRTADLALIARNSAKPGRAALSEGGGEGGHAGGPESWIIHASPEWSRAHLEHTPEAACALLLDLLADRLGEVGPAAHASAHRWRYAQTAKPLGAPFLAAAPGLWIGGDWALGNRIEAGFDSGRAMAAAALAARG